MEAKPTVKWLEIWLDLKLNFKKHIKKKWRRRSESFTKLKDCLMQKEDYYFKQSDSYILRV